MLSILVRSIGETLGLILVGVVTVGEMVGTEDGTEPIGTVVTGTVEDATITGTVVTGTVEDATIIGTVEVGAVAESVEDPEDNS